MRTPDSAAGHREPAGGETRFDQVDGDKTCIQTLAAVSFLHFQDASAAEAVATLMSSLSPDALRRLTELGTGLVKRGDVFWLPKKHVEYYESEKDRYCIVAALEPTANGKVAHLVPGTSGRARGPRLVVPVGETDLPKRTEFDFSTSYPLPVETLVAAGTPKGSLPANRLAELDTVIGKSKRAALKRLVSE